MAVSCLGDKEGSKQQFLDAIQHDNLIDMGKPLLSQSDKGQGPLVQQTRKKVNPFHRRRR